MGQEEWDDDTEADAPRAQLLLAMIARRISLVSYTAAWEGMRGMASYGPAPPLDGAKGEEALRGIGCAHGVVVFDGDTYGRGRAENWPRSGRERGES